MAIESSIVIVVVNSPPRGGGSQTAGTFYAQSFQGTFAWGAQPGYATVTYVAATVGTESIRTGGVNLGAYLELQTIGHTFYGVCRSDVATEGSGGKTRTLEFVDLREFLAWDYVFASFNQSETRLVEVAGKLRRRKRYRHLLPYDYSRGAWSFTDTPYTVWQVLDFIFRAPTVETKWKWIAHFDMSRFPALDLDFSNGERLDSALTRVSEKIGLVFTLDDTPTAFSPYTLRWARKGYLLTGETFPIDPTTGRYLFRTAPSDEDCRDGFSWSGQAARVHVIGDQNAYQILNVPLVKDWKVAWEVYYDVELLVEFVYNQFSDATGAFNAYPGDDADHTIGWQLARAKTLDLTVRELAVKKDAIAAGSGEAFRDYRKLAGRSRMDMPCAIYISTVLFRAFKPVTPLVIQGGEASIESVSVAEQQLAQVTHDAATGLMTADLNEPLEGNGYAVVQGYNVGSDFFSGLRADRFKVSLWKDATKLWTQVPFRIDNPGDGGWCVLFDAPVFSSDNLLVDDLSYAAANGKVFFAANPTLTTPMVRASLTFIAERFRYIWPKKLSFLPRDAVVQENGRSQEGIEDYARQAALVEIPYADGKTAAEKAQEIATATLEAQWAYRLGGFKRYLFAGDAGTRLNGIYDRVTVEQGSGGLWETVDFTTERARNWFDPARDYDRRVQQQGLFPGQQELRATARILRQTAGVLRQSPDLRRDLAAAIRGQVGSPTPTVLAQFAANGDAAQLLPAGTPVLASPSKPNVGVLPASTTTAQKVLVGITTQHSAPAVRVYVQNTGRAAVRVKGPVSAGDTLAVAPGQDYLVRAADATNDAATVATCWQDIADTSIKVVFCDLTAGGEGGGEAVWA